LKSNVKVALTIKESIEMGNDSISISYMIFIN